MALANASRCSDLEALDRGYLRWTPTGAQFTICSVFLVICSIQLHMHM